MKTHNFLRISIIALVIVSFITLGAYMKLYTVIPEKNITDCSEQNISKGLISSISTKEIHNKTVVYQWEYNGSSWEWQLELPGNLYEYSDRTRFYKNTLTEIKHDFLQYINDERDDIFIVSLAEALINSANGNSLTETEELNLIISFVQAIPYEKDLRTRGVKEYPRFPIQTLWDGHGDCEDMSILLCALLNALGYDNILLASSDHIAVGISGDFKGEYYLYNGNKYYYIETTDIGWQIGQKPKNFINNTVFVVE